MKRLTPLGWVAAGALGALLLTILTAASPNFTARIVDSLGNVLGGVASATSASYNYTIRIVDSSGKVRAALGPPNVIIPTGVACDGSTDDRAAFNTAATSAAGGVLLLPAKLGTCLIGSNLTF